MTNTDSSPTAGAAQPNPIGGGPSVARVLLVFLAAAVAGSVAEAAVLALAARLFGVPRTTARPVGVWAYALVLYPFARSLGPIRTAQWWARPTTSFARWAAATAALCAAAAGLLAAFGLWHRAA